MGKRSSFDRNARDLYRTWDKRAVLPLLDHLPPGSLYAEPCAASGDLIDLLTGYGHTCIYAADIEPLRGDVVRADVLTAALPPYIDLVITNPPWQRGLLHDIILILCAQTPAWLLFDADWMQTQQSAPFMRYCVKVIAIGRVRWIPGTPHDGKDNAAWYLFDMRHDGAPTLFYPRKRYHQPPSSFGVK